MVPDSARRFVAGSRAHVVHAKASAWQWWLAQGQAHNHRHAGKPLVRQLLWGAGVRSGYPFPHGLWRLPSVSGPPPPSFSLLLHRLAIFEPSIHPLTGNIFGIRASTKDQGGAVKSAWT